MGNQEFMQRCKQMVCDYYNERVDKTDKAHLTEDDVFVVWCCKTIQNNKALLITTMRDGMYYEITHNGDKGEVYLDAYKKWEKVCIKL